VPGPDGIGLPEGGGYGTVHPTTIVIAGVAGVGKSTVMARLEERLAWATLEGDELHPPANVEKMRRGIPLDDADRWPWLDRIGAWIDSRERHGEDAVLTCSALRRDYRDRLRAGRPSVWFALLEAPLPALEARIVARTGHFMPPELLVSQLDVLEPLALDEPGRIVDASRPPDSIADWIIEALTRDGRRIRPAAS
jgi:gluconokinase